MKPGPTDILYELENAPFISSSMRRLAAAEIRTLRHKLSLSESKNRDNGVEILMNYNTENIVDGLLSSEDGRKKIMEIIRIKGKKQLPLITHYNCGVSNCGGGVCVHKVLDERCPHCNNQMILVTTNGNKFCSGHNAINGCDYEVSPSGDKCFECDQVKPLYEIDAGHYFCSEICESKYYEKRQKS